MVAKITTPKNVKAALNYNEQKVQKGNAESIYAGNCLKEAGEMNFYEKLTRLENLNSLNKRAATNTLHISLNFSVGENFSYEKLISIASSYMDKLGFGEQPYFVYKHDDAGHPHIHIVTTTIKADGSRINTHNIGRNQSEKARKEVELKYGLVKAEAQKQIVSQIIQPANIEKITYGKLETKKSISTIVSAVFSQYKYVSLPEFNAALKQFNVIADRGKEEGRIFKNRGLVYRIFDKDGNKIGVPIKASSLPCKPTLANLEKKFLSNEILKFRVKEIVKSSIDECFGKSLTDFKNLQVALEQKQIYLLLRKNSEGRLYGVTFVDNKNKCVFNGSDLGKNYSITALQNRITVNENKEKDNIKNETFTQNADSKNIPTSGHSINKLQEEISLSKSENLIEVLLKPTNQQENIPFSLLPKKKKKDKKNHLFISK